MAVKFSVSNNGCIQQYSTPEGVYNHVISKMYPLVIGRRAPQNVFDAAEKAEKWCRNAKPGSTYHGSVIGKSFTIEVVENILVT